MNTIASMIRQTIAREKYEQTHSARERYTAQYRHERECRNKRVPYHYVGSSKASQAANLSFRTVYDRTEYGGPMWPDPLGCTYRESEIRKFLSYTMIQDMREFIGMAYHFNSNFMLSRQHKIGRNK